MVVAQEVQRCPVCFELRSGVEDLDAAVEDIMSLVSNESSLILTETAWIEQIIVNVKKFGDFYPPKRRENKPLPPYVAKIDHILEELSTKAWEMFGIGMYMADLFVTGSACTVEMRALIALLGQFCGNLKDRRNILLYNLPSQTPGKHYLTGEKFDAGQAVETTHHQQQMSTTGANSLMFGGAHKRAFKYSSRSAFFNGQRQPPRVFARREIEPSTAGYASNVGYGAGGTNYAGYGAGGTGYAGYGGGFNPAGVCPNVVGPLTNTYRPRRASFGSAGTAAAAAGFGVNAGAGAGGNAGAGAASGVGRGNV
jgi:hypothetical protein